MDAGNQCQRDNATQYGGLSSRDSVSRTQAPKPTAPQGTSVAGGTYGAGGGGSAPIGQESDKTAGVGEERTSTPLPVQYDQSAERERAPIGQRGVEGEDIDSSKDARYIFGSCTGIVPGIVILSEEGDR